MIKKSLLTRHCVSPGLGVVASAADNFAQHISAAKKASSSATADGFHPDNPSAAASSTAKVDGAVN